MKSRNLLFATVLGSASLPALGADITMTGSDGIGASSFNAGTNWPGPVAPTGGNNYFTGNNTLRTPPNANALTFAGDSLTVNNTTAYPNGLFYKGTGTTATTGTITINNLILNGGLISHGQGDSQFFNLAGNISVTSASTIWAKQGPTNIYSSISGSSTITVPIPDADIPSRTLIFHSSASTFTGNLVNNGRFALADNAVFNFAIGAAGVNNRISGTGSTTTFNGDFAFDLTGASANKGDTWSIITAAGKIFGSTFTVAGFTDNFDDTWSKDIGGGLSYQFKESTGTLTVVSPPQNLVWLGGGGIADAWDINTTLNWQDGVPDTVKYFDGDNVSFTNAGIPNPAVDVTVAVAPGSVTVDSTSAYSFFGVGKITGSTGLTKNNSGVLTLGTANDYTGNTLIDSGTVITNVAGAIPGGAGKGDTTLTAGTLLNLNTFSQTLNNLSGAGTIDNTAVGTPVLTLSNTVPSAFSGAIQNTAGTLAVTKTGTGTLTLSGANTYSGTTSVTGGTLLATSAAALPGYNAASKVSVASGATLAVRAGSVGEWTSSEIDSVLGATTAAFASGSSLGIDVATGNSFSYANDIGATQAAKSLVKSGDDTLTLSGANTYSGTTALNAGTLVLSGTSTNTGAFNMANNTTLQLVANVGNTASGISSVMGGIHSAFLIAPTGGTNTTTVQLRSDSNVTFANTNPTGGTGNWTGNFDVNQVTAGNNDKTLSFAVGGFNTFKTVINVSGDNGYTLQLGTIGTGFNSTLVLNANTANLTVGGIGASSHYTALTVGGEMNTAITGPITGPISGTGTSLTKSDGGTLTLSGLNTYTGDTTVTGGTLVITNDDVLADTSTVTLPASGSLNLTHSGTDTVTGLVIGGEPQPNGLYTFGTGKLKVGISTPFEDWAILKGLDGTAGKENGPAADPDKDGSTNLAEFAFNGNPLSGSDNGQVYVLTADSDGDLDAIKELVLTLAVRKTTPAFTAGAPATAPLTDGITYSIHGSTELATFGVTVTPVGFVDPGVALTDAINYEYRSFSLDGSNGLAGKGFLRAVSTAP